MPNPRKRKTLTDRGIAALKLEPGKRRRVFDSLIPGLAVRVTERGVKTFVLITRLHGKQRWVTLARVGVLSLADAPAEAGKAIIKAKAGEDPRPGRQWRTILAPSSRTSSSVTPRRNNQASRSRASQLFGPPNRQIGESRPLPEED